MITDHYINQTAYFKREYHDAVVIITASIGLEKVREWYFRWDDPALSMPDIYETLSAEL